MKVIYNDGRVDVCAPEDGTVASVEVAKGTTVETDAVLVTLN